MRQATRYDKAAIKNLLRAFRDESGFAELQHIDDSEYFDRSLDSILAGEGIVFLEEGKGLLAAIVLPSIWCNKTFVMHELAWYVLPEHRGGSIGHRLLQAYLLYGRDLKQSGRIKYFTISKLDTSSDFDYSRYGFKKKDENWIQ